MPYTVGVLTISDTSFKHRSSDKSGPLLASLLEQHDAFNVALRDIVPDDADLIQEALRRWIDVFPSGATQRRADLVICTGGTGFGVRDVTPEAVSGLIDKQSPGLTHALMQHSLTKTPLAALSRLVTGVRIRRTNPSTVHAASSTTSSNSLHDDNCLLIALPGSSKAVKECCEVLLSDDGLLLHALDLLNGGSGREKHAQMQGQVHITGTETDTGRSHHGHHDRHNHSHQHHHHHGHGHGHGLAGHKAPQPRTTQDEASSSFKTHDPAQSVTLRKRASPYPIITLDEAFSLILSVAQCNPAVTLPTTADLRGCLLAEAVFAPRDLPPVPTTNVDGYAVKASDTPPGDYAVVTRGGKLTGKAVYRINTGQGLPEGADAVLMVEDSDLLEEADGEEKTISVKAQIDAGENVRQAGSDVRQGQQVLAKGVKLGELGGEIGTLAFLGLGQVRVIRKPRIAVLSTGNELYDVASAADASQADAWGFRVFDANRPSLTAALRGAGFDVVDLGIVGDDIDKTLTALNRGLEEADVVISTGGTSMGESDLLKPLIERRLRAGTIHFGRVAMKPGKPTTFASAESQSGQKRLLFALPGNPASAMVCLYVFVMPALRKMAGYAPQHCPLARVRVRLQDDLRCDPRPEFHRVVITVQDGQLYAASTGSQRSSGMHSMATANALICVPSSASGGPGSLSKGSEAEAIVLGSII